MRSLIFAVFVFAAAAAESAPVTWTLGNIVFFDESVAAGSFVMDSITGDVTEVNITTTSDGYSYPGASYTPVDSVYDPANGVIEFYTDYYPGVAGESAFVLFLSNNFSLGGGTYQLDGGGEFICAGYPCATNYTDYRSFSGGTISSGVPVPAAAWLFLSSLSVLGFARRRIVAL